MKKTGLKHRIPKELTTVTPLSKGLAAIIFVLLPFVGFLIGIQYQQSVYLLEYKAKLNDSNFQSYSTQPTPQPASCTLEALICPDGSAVGRVGPNCEFAACPGQ